MNNARNCQHCHKHATTDEVFCRHCGARLPDLGLQAGQKVGRHYRIEAVIGQGGMGQVVRATHDLTDQVVAIKTLSPHLAADPGLRERFLQEARALAGLDHPNIMTLHTFLEDEGKLYLVMQYIDGQDVDAMFRRCGGLSPRAAIPILQCALRGLGYAHRQGIIHRDLKPANIMVTRDGRVKLTDFGIALMRGGLRLTVTGAQVGTVFYMAPEQLQGDVAKPRSDIYAMGVSLFETIAGRLPFEGDDYAVRKGHVEDPVPDIRLFRPDTPDFVVHAIHRALAKRAEQRFQTAEEFCDALGDWGNVLPLVECPLCSSKHPVGEGVTCSSCGKDEICGFHMVEEYHMCQLCVQQERRPSSSEPSRSPAIPTPFNLEESSQSQRAPSSHALARANHYGSDSQPPPSRSTSSTRGQHPTFQPATTSSTRLSPSEQTSTYQTGNTSSVSVAARSTSSGQTLPPNITTSDRMEMVLIPEGYFILGAHDEPNANPPKRCYMRAYYIDQTPVTNASYERFIKETGYSAPQHWLNSQEHNGRFFSPELTLHPVVNTTYDDAQAYARWAGKRLPSEAEWEKAARGTDSRLYTWEGDWIDGMAHFGSTLTSPVLSHAKGKSPYGVYDMLGNVWEWVADWYLADSYKHMQETAPMGPSEGKYRVIRGGSHPDPPRTVRVTTRNFRPPNLPGVAIGFRCVLDP